jgi:hypothetical protein
LKILAKKARKFTAETPRRAKTALALRETEKNSALSAPLR